MTIEKAKLVYPSDCARTKWREILDAVEYDNEEVIITRFGVVIAKIIPTKGEK